MPRSAEPQSHLTWGGAYSHPGVMKSRQSVHRVSTPGGHLLFHRDSNGGNQVS